MSKCARVRGQVARRRRPWWRGIVGGVGAETQALADAPTRVAADASTTAELLAAPGDQALHAPLIDVLKAQVERGAGGARLGRYALLRVLGEGGMGVVFAAYDPQLDRKVAIKLVRPAYTATSGGEAKARLLREAQALAKLRHPNIVTVYEVGEYGDEVFVAMEFVDGVTLRTWQFEHARSWREVVRVYVAAGRGLAAAHRAGLVHRDFKPDNVLVGADGQPRVADFGLAREDRPALAEAAHNPGEGGLLADRLTATGVVMGTPMYMSPEQHLGLPAGPALEQALAEFRAGLTINPKLPNLHNGIGSVLAEQAKGFEALDHFR